MPRPRFLLVQVRDNPLAERQEQLCFLERCGIAEDQMAVVNLVGCDEPARALAAADEVDAVMIGGAGAHSVTRTYTFSRPLEDTVRRLVEEGRPFFGSCWGHQFLAQALGGSVVCDPPHGEVGTFDVALTPAGAADPLFEGLPARFPVQLGHHDRVVTLPPGVEELAFSDVCRHQVIRVTGKPVYGSQFHSEMTIEHMRQRLHMYRDAYLPGEDAVEELLRILRPTPEADRLLGRFLDLYVR